ncbi:hypothetical protein LCGC14_0295720 [marine sediment metagenome]|uniref:Riboflavin synthase n=1 Tax=marine sediment metagenome TaxID=412755 RepID=A0A0F9U8S6_9ZZZZ|nr:riboflavin synthase [Phycisphaerae bacterium]HDZ43018.1 riboflavin synthase [Phycisphaerae bacterium]
MFTGIIRHVGSLRSIAPAAGGQRLSIDLGPLAAQVARGDSVAVCGVCLTAADLSGSAASFDVMAQTLETTTLGSLSTGAKVNLELALRAGGGLDGHLVQGHVDGLAELADIRRGDRYELTFRADDEVTATMASKGSVAVDGVSLTIADVDGQTFRVALIPTTLAETTLGERVVGDKVNVETDIIGKYVRRYLSQLGGSGRDGLTLEKLREAGFC